jgi:hypothetical protein
MKKVDLVLKTLILKRFSLSILFEENDITIFWLFSGKMSLPVDPKSGKNFYFIKI